jgi:hypothetical protein
LRRWSGNEVKWEQDERDQEEHGHRRERPDLGKQDDARLVALGQMTEVLERALPCGMSSHGAMVARALGRGIRGRLDSLRNLRKASAHRPMPMVAPSAMIGST